MVPLGPGLWRAHRSSSVIGTGMQKPGQFVHGEFTELNVTGAQVLVAVAESKEPPILVVPSITSIRVHGAGAAVGAGAGSMATSSFTAVADHAAVIPGAPVSSTSGPDPPPTRVNVNLGHTFKVESNVLALIFIDPVEALYADRPTATSQCCEGVPLLKVTVIGLMLFRESPVIVRAVLPPGAETVW